jgi:hypothetical protein
MLHDTPLDDPTVTYAIGQERAGFYPLNNVAAFLENSSLLGSNRGSLPFRITLARTEEQLAKAVALRASTFGRRSLQLATVLGKPDETDYSPNSVVLIAESKENQDCLGTLRIVSNLSTPLEFESHPQFPAALAGRRIAQAERLGVVPGKVGTLAKLTLFKALHRYCLALQIDWIFVQATPPRDRDYRLLGFKQVMEDVSFDSKLDPDKSKVTLAMNVHMAEREFHDSGHHLYKFMIATWHPDIEIFSSVQSQWSRPRAAALGAGAARPTSSTMSKPPMAGMVKAQ